MRVDFPSANNLLRNAGHEVQITAEGVNIKTSIVQLLVKLQYLPATPAEHKELVSRVSIDALLCALRSMMRVGWCVGLS